MGAAPKPLSSSSMVARHPRRCHRLSPLLPNAPSPVSRRSPSPITDRIAIPLLLMPASSPPCRHHPPCRRHARSTGRPPLERHHHRLPRLQAAGCWPCRTSAMVAASSPPPFPSSSPIFTTMAATSHQPDLPSRRPCCHHPSFLLSEIHRQLLPKLPPCSNLLCLPPSSMDTISFLHRATSSFHTHRPSAISATLRPPVASFPSPANPPSFLLPITIPPSFIPPSSASLPEPHDHFLAAHGCCPSQSRRHDPSTITMPRHLLPLVKMNPNQRSPRHDPWHPIDLSCTKQSIRRSKKTPMYEGLSKYDLH